MCFHLSETRLVGVGVPFERIRRITGYLGTTDRFSNAKRSEERDRVKHVSAAQNGEEE